MPDITMCWGRECPLKQNCYRYTAKPSEFRQSYFKEIPWDGKTCNYQWKDQSTSLVNRTKNLHKARKRK